MSRTYRRGFVWRRKDRESSFQFDGAKTQSEKTCKPGCGVCDKGRTGWTHQQNLKQRYDKSYKGELE